MQAMRGFVFIKISMLDVDSNDLYVVERVFGFIVLKLLCGTCAVVALVWS
jgi:hypothetical protein